MNGRRTGAGFTMLEILLVVVIIAIASAVALPSFARSFRGAKLRASTRMVMMMHRHAQSKAVLGQRYMAILFDEVKGTVELVDQGQAGQKKDSLFGNVGGTGGADALGPDPAGGAASAEAAPVLDTLLVRKLEEGVKIVSFQGGKEIDDLHYVNYYPNGMCEGYEIEIGDDENRTAHIQVDAVTGKAKVKRE
jgi:prepilin-type N-terminal cleavage/methylation domain-containing protein